MKKIALVLALMIPAFAPAQNLDERVKSISNELADQIVKKDGKKVAVSTILYKDCPTEFGKLLAEDITGNLSVSGRPVTVVNQKALETLMEQNQLSAKGILELKSDAARLGKVSGIDALVYGSVSSRGEELSIALSVVKLPTLEVLGYAKSTVPLTAAIKDMLQCLETGKKPDTPKEDKTAFQFPTPPANCQAMQTCIICVTNKGSIPIKADRHVVLTGGYERLYIHPGNTKCLDTKLSRKDHSDVQMTYTTDAGFRKRETFVIEPCQVYQRTFTD